MWIALTILFALLSLVLYMSNRELDKELKLKDIIIDNLIERNEKMNKRDYYLKLVKRIEGRIEFCEEEVQVIENSIKKEQQYSNKLEDELNTLEAVKEDILNKLL